MTTFPIAAVSAPLLTDHTTEQQARLEALLARLEHVLGALEPVLPLVARAPDMIATAADSFDDLVAQGKRVGIDFDERLRGSLHVLERLTHPATRRQLEVLLDRLPALERLAPMLDALPNAVDRAQHDAQPLGLFGLLGALRDPAMQRTLGLGVAVARALDAHTPPATGAAR
jgi:hypothetical protein